MLLGEAAGEVLPEDDEFVPAPTAQLDLSVRGRSVSPSQSPERGEWHDTPGVASSVGAPTAASSSWGASTSHAAIAAGTQDTDVPVVGAASGDAGISAGVAISASGADSDSEGAATDDEAPTEEWASDEDEEQYDDAHEGEQPAAELAAAHAEYAADAHGAEVAAIEALQVHLVGLALGQAPDPADVAPEEEDSGLWFKNEAVVTALWEAVLAHPLTLGVRL